MELHLDHDDAAHRYRLVGDGAVVSLADYRVIDDGRTLVFHHTFTSPEKRGQGLAAELVRRTLDDVRRSGRTVVATCWFVDQFIDAHPEYADLRS